MTDTIEQHDMTDDATRRKIFWLLQRVTSLSHWTRKREGFARFANAYGHAANTWLDDDPEPIRYLIAPETGAVLGIVGTK
ncbi:hypothetical protein WT97_22780 [Burkholderia sp. MSMB1459WGS]|uniref:hypothetical protein n=2 Tax=Burkholderia TaxID=32008 RepID=UPI00075BFAB2|nr:hypothetical protein [Burkholderia sp. ABCPW 11]KVD42147.1 hypothetical protein WS61_19095 [Burkholderia sp. ABCPW 11]KVT15683.1 hypothetical protein WT24_05930 [Burkholderia sp. MSMB1078WGS]KWO39429.1 hypothetical protein WT97_22780 [Burkholderia sp. MSMB1459WGS]